MEQEETKGDLEGQARGTYLYLCDDENAWKATGATKQWREGGPGGAQEGCRHEEQRPDVLPGAGKSGSHWPGPSCTPMQNGRFRSVTQKDRGP